MTLLSVVLALALTAALAACGSDEPSGGTGPGGTASTPTETPASPARTPSTAGAGDAPAASGSAETDREALVALYNATDGENWDKSDNWLGDAPIGEWRGVTTDDGGRVKTLDFGLGGNGLSGEIPPELGSLSNLKELLLSGSMFGNRLSGEIPPELGSLSNLEELVLDYNNLSGEIPAELGSLSNLTTLNLSGTNDLSGEIPPELGSLSNLIQVELHGIDLSGCVPSSLTDQLNSSSSLGGLPFC